jgi:GT2 family glycosyltransferase
VPADLRATVVVVNWNGERLLRPCLDALARQSAPFGFQVWVVDNASSDGSVALLEREYPAVRVLRNAENRGFAGGNNAALREVTTPFAVLLNNDAVPEPDWLERLLAPFDEPGAERLAAVTSKVLFAPRYARISLSTAGFRAPGDPRELGVRVRRVVVDGVDVTARVLWERLTWGPEGSGADRFSWTRPAGELLLPLPDASGPYELALQVAAEADKPLALSWEGGGTTLPVTRAFAEHVVDLPARLPLVDVVNNAGSVVLTAGYGADRGFQEVDDGRYDTAEEVFALCGCAVAVRTAAGAQVGWFDEGFFLYYEDTDLSWRLRAAGWTVRYEPSAVVRHLHAASSVEWSPVFVFHTDRNRLLMLVKDATAARALKEVLRYPLTTGSVLLRSWLSSVRERRRPPVRPTLLRLRVMASFLRLLPAALAARRRPTVVPRRELERWLVSSR